MKKSILFVLCGLLLWACSAFSTVSYINGNFVTGMLRSSVSNHTALYSKTNAQKGDLYFVMLKVSNYATGIWQAQKTTPRVATNWKIIMESVPTNFIHSFPGNTSAWSNVVMTSYTQLQHVVYTAQIGASNIIATNRAKAYTRSEITTESNRIVALSNRVASGSNRLVTATNTMMNNLTNYFCWGQVWMTNSTTNKITPTTNTPQKGSGWTAWTNASTSTVSCQNTNLIQYLAVSNCLKIGSGGVGNYEMSYDAYGVTSSTNAFTFTLLIGANSKTKFTKNTIGGLTSKIIHASAIINIPATTTIRLGICQPNASTATISLKNVIVWIRRIR